MTDVTVITATIEGREAMLQECKDSVRAQTVQPKRHMIYKDTHRRGIRWSMNVLWPQVKTPWLQWLADDDLLLPHHLETVIPFTEDYDIIHTHCAVTGREGFLPNHPGHEVDYWLPATALIRTSLVKELGGWSMTDWPEDHHFWLKARDAGARFHMVPTVTWTYRFHGSNLTFARNPR